ncbi:MAG: helix-turn-helix domain-containing protein [Pseudomonadota bacterium]
MKKTTLNDRVREAVDSYSSAADLARDMGVSKAAISGWVRGTTKNIKSENLHKLAALTEFSPTWILYGQGPKSAVEALFKANQDGEKERVSNGPIYVGEKRYERRHISLLDNYLKLPAETRRFVRAFIEFSAAVAEPEKQDRISKHMRDAVTKQRNKVSKVK